MSEASVARMANRYPGHFPHFVALMRATGRREILENGVNRKVEIERMQAAFKRAAEKATHGSREERSVRSKYGTIRV
jgi:hypothetical protein